MDQNLLKTAKQTLQLLQKLNWMKVTLQELVFHSFKVQSIHWGLKFNFEFRFSLEIN